MGTGSSIVLMEPRLLEIQKTNFEILQIYLSANESIEQLKSIYIEIESGRLIMFRITKVSLIANPTLLDAYLFWIQFVSMCNKGEGSKNNVLFAFKGESFVYDVGQCGDLKLQWFGEIYAQYMSQVFQAALRVPALIERLRIYHKRLVSIAKKPDELLVKNATLLKLNVELMERFEEKIKQYNVDIKQLQERQAKILSSVDEIGAKLYTRFGIKTIQAYGKEKYIMKVKANQIIQTCFIGQFRSELEEEMQRLEKLRRATTKQEADNDLSSGFKRFPWRMKWCGCLPVDLSLGQVSSILEAHSSHLLHLKRYSIFLRYLTKSYLTQEDSIQQAWKIFCCSIKDKERDFLQVDLIKGLGRIKFIDPNQELCRKYFIFYFELLEPQKIQQLKAMWETYSESQTAVIALWKDNEILNLPEFKALPRENKYYVLTTLAKNIYALQQYCVTAQKVYDEYYMKKVAKGLKFRSEYQKIYDDSLPSNKLFKEIYDKMPQQMDQQLMKKKETKLQYTFTKFH